MRTVAPVEVFSLKAVTGWPESPSHQRMGSRFGATFPPSGQRATSAVSHLTRLQHIQYVSTVAPQTADLTRSQLRICLWLAARLQPQSNRKLRQNSITAPENVSIAKFEPIQYLSEGDSLFCFFSFVFRLWVIGPPVLCCHKRPHFNQTSHRDSTELPGGHKSTQTATDVKWYRSKARRGGCSSQTTRQGRSAAITCTIH